MCTTCGCGGPVVVIDGHAHHEHDPAHAHDHTHPQDHDHSHEHAHTTPQHSHAPGVDATRALRIEQDVLASNNAYAAANRRRLAAHGVFAVNLMSSPGAGKTTLLVATINALAGRAPVAVIEGDQQTARDAERIRATGAATVQINTGKGCHLDAHMVGHALEHLVLPRDGVLFIENVGNLVCPAAFDLGEARKVVLLSVTEGEDKPLKYPDMFTAADLLLLTKIDLLPHLQFDVDACLRYAREINPRAQVLKLSATRGIGMDDWLAWLQRQTALAPEMIR
jgi:hydrogenase nickel incorporation protein HypB